MKTLLLLKNRSSARRCYLIDAISARWASWGHRVITHYGAVDLPLADLTVLHVDRTLVPDRYANALGPEALVLNRGAVDISKRRYSRILVTREDGYTGPVIVKTDRNFGGAPEASRFGYLAAKLTNRWNLARTATLNPNRYPIFNSKSQVPRGVWDNNNLIVEKFMPEREKGLFFVRYWIFLGDQGWAGRIGCKTPIAKFSRMVTDDEPVEIPDELLRLRSAMGLDYGRIDFTVHNGRAVVFDINKTVGGARHVAAYANQLEQLAKGVYHYL